MVVELRQISKTFPHSDFRLEDISFEIKSNEVIGLVGQNGTGKSTILKMINALLPFDSGEIYYKGQNIQSLSPLEQRQMRKKLCYIFQNANLLGNKTVDYHLNLVYKLNKQKPDGQKIADILQFMGISDLRKQTCASLSGGQQQKVAIAMALLSEPQVLLCDEISSALDSKSEREIFSLLAQLRQQKQIAIVMISHNLSLIKNFCDRVLFLEEGRISKSVIPKSSKKSEDAGDYYHYAEEFLQS